MPYPDRSAYPDRFYPVVDSVAWVARLALLGVGTVQLRAKNLKDADLLTFARWVNQDIEKGGNPSMAASARANALITASRGS